MTFSDEKNWNSRGLVKVVFLSTAGEPLPPVRACHRKLAKLLKATKMPLRDPIAAYNAANNLEAHLVCNALEESGVEAMVVEDNSVVGLWYFGTLPEIHKPQVWVERASIDQAKAVIEQYERDASRRREELAAGDPVGVICEECGEQSSYPPTQRGTVQDCPHCGAYVDVDDTPWDATNEASESDR